MRQLLKIAALVCIVTLATASLCACDRNNGFASGKFSVADGNYYSPVIEEKTMTRSFLEDKVKGSWIGQAIGCGSGYEYLWLDGQPWVAMEDKYWEPEGHIVSGTLGCNYLKVGPVDDTYERFTKGRVLSDDDMHIDLFNMYVIEKYGVNISSYELTKAWNEYNVSDGASGYWSMQVIQNKNYISPYCGQYAFGNSLYCATEPWIENESLGLLFPYMSATAEAYAELFVPVSGDAYALYLGELLAIATSYALTQNNAVMALESAFNHMSKSNDVYDIYRYVKECYDSGEYTWRDCVLGIVEQHQGHRLMEINTQIAINVCAGFVFAAIIYGNNDFEESIKIASLSGYDGDCTAASVGCLLGAALGYDALPEKYRDFLDSDGVYVNDLTWFAHIGGDYPGEETWQNIIDRTVSNAEKMIVANGGKVEDGVYTVKAQTYVKPKDVGIANYGFQKGNTEGWECDDNASLSVSSIAHTGKYGAFLVQNDTSKRAVAYQIPDEFVKGDIYRITAYLSSDSGKDVRIFAEDEKNKYFRSLDSTVYDVNRFTRLDFEFIATSDRMKIGIELAGDNSDFNSVYFDDFTIENISNAVQRNGDRFEAEECARTSDTEILSDKGASNGGVLKLNTASSVKITFAGEKNIYQNVRVFYKNTNSSIAEMLVYVDGLYRFTLPLLPQGGNTDYTDGNFADFNYYFGEGDCEVIFKLGTDATILIDKIEVRKGNMSIMRG